MPYDYPIFTDEELQNEEWRAIDGYNGVYEVSNLGRVRRTTNAFQFDAGRVMRGSIHPVGYHAVFLCKYGKKRRYSIHRLVAAAFLPKDKLRNCVNHKDSNRTNNRVENLAYVTHWENSQHAVLNGRMLPGEKNPSHKLSEAQVREIRRRLAAGELGNTLAIEFGMGESQIHRIRVGRSWKHIL